MTADEMRRLKTWFASMVRRSQSTDGDVRVNIRLKAHHTYQVCREARMVGTGIGLDPDELHLIEAAALLHDVGRFEQYLRYRTFNDAESTDHAALGLEILHRTGVLARLGEDDAQLIVDAIRSHNRPQLPADLSERGLLFSKILRDADKLDIWNIIVGYYEQREEERNKAIAMGLPDTPGVSLEVLRRLREQEAAFRGDLKNLNDLKLFHIGWVYDVNLQPTFHAVAERRYVERIAKTLPITAEIQDSVRTALEFVSEKGGGPAGGYAGH
jgi:HD superfamily phosphohydrolase YqeK